MLLQIVILTSCSLAAARDWAFTILSDDKYVIMYLGVCLNLSCHITDPASLLYQFLLYTCALFALGNLKLLCIV
jgi:hypothetical protein